MDYLEFYKDEFTNQECVILGGGPNTPEDYWACPQKATFKIGVNQHACLLEDLQFIVFHDPKVWEVVKNHPAKKITIHENFEGIIQSGICPQFGFSGAQAVWIAEYMGFEKIHLCGFGCYEDQSRDYWHSLSGEFTHSHALQFESVWNLVKRKMQNPNKVNVLSGPLKEIFHA
jgi:hypothetical protein